MEKNLMEKDPMKKNPMVYEIYYLKESEIRLMLAGLGRSMWYGLFSGPEAGGEPAWTHTGTLNRILAGLHEKGAVDWQDRQTVIRQPFAGIFASMLESDTCVIMEAPGRGPLRCCYLSGQWVVVTVKSQREAGTVGMCRLSVQEWLKLAETEVWQLEEGQSLSLVCRGSGNGRIRRRIRIVREGIRTRRLEWDNGSPGVAHCMQEELPERLLALLWPGGCGRKETQ